MPNFLTTSVIYCPYCGEQVEILVDNSAGTQDYIEDCQVCCAPIEIFVQIDPTGQIENIKPKRDSD